MEEPDVASNCSKELVYPELPGPGCVVDTNQDEIVVAILILLLVLVTFYRLIHVWAYTLNFSEVSPCRCHHQMSVSLPGEYPGSPGLGHCHQLDRGEGEEDQEVHQVAEAGPGPPCPLSPPPDTEGGVAIRRHVPSPGETLLPTSNISEVNGC